MSSPAARAPFTTFWLLAEFIPRSARSTESACTGKNHNGMGHKYDYEIDLNDGSAPARVVRMVGREKRVLEIGAGPGSMTRVLRNTFGCRITAIEIDESVIPALTPFCERVYCTDLNDPSWTQALEHEHRY